MRVDSQPSIFGSRWSAWQHREANGLANVIEERSTIDTMSAAPRRIPLEISEHFFRLTTESLRLHANETMQFQTLDSLLARRIFGDAAGVDQQAETIREHLSTVPTGGDIQISVNIAQASADNLAALKRQLDEMLGRSLTLADTISVALFNYVVGQKAAGILQRLWSRDAATEAESSASGGNVVRLRATSIQNGAVAVR